MNNDIKEILDKLNNMIIFDENLIGWQIDGNGTTISKKDFKVLLDYITNLQKENKHLKSELECYENGLYFSSEVDKLQEKINKAIDVLLNYGETFDSKIHQEMQKELLNILQEVK